MNNRILSRSFQKRFIICFLIYLSCGAVFSVFAEDTEEIETVVFFFKDVDLLKSPVKIRLEGFMGNSVDMSAVISALERVKQSQHDHFFYLERVSFSKISEKIESLCEKAFVSFLCRLQANKELREALDRIHQDLKDRILYPDGYREIGSSGRFLFKKAMDILDSDCLEKCEDDNLINAIRSLSERDYPLLYAQIKTKDERCQRDILNALVTKLRKERFPKKCLEEENKTHPVCETMTKDIKTLQGRILEISKLAYTSDVFETMEAQALCVDCANQMNSINQVKRVDEVFGDLLKFIHIHSQCSELKPGQQKRIYSNTGRSRIYTVKKESDGTYSIPLTLRFSADDDYDGDTPRDQVPAHYMKKVQKCMNKASTKMLGPDGEKLKIVIQESTQQKTADQCKKDIKEIKIGSEDYRSRSKKYGSDIDCPAITHEILHLLGLCDEYEDGQYKCRMTMTNSIMSDHNERWKNVFKKGKNKSLLTPGQFNAILYGACDKKNRIFNECAQLAYETLNERFDCMKRKQQCETHDFSGSGR